ncbi:MAG: hypothetical protein RJA55_3169 [Acidobacteriota bacterium]|jgi:hypothetical protein
MRRAHLILIAVFAVTTAACAKAQPPAMQPSAPVAGAVLWVEPTDLATRDVFHGPWGQENAPNSADTFRYVETKRSGVNRGMTVKDSQGREWSVKTPFPGNLDSEAPVEVTVSRLLSAVGYPQPPVYFLPAFDLKDDLGTRTLVGGRFRLTHPSLTDAGSWSWAENPFVGTPPYQGLLVMMMMLNNSDMKDRNNTLYQRRAGDLVEQWYAVRDAGAALGDTTRWAPRTNHIESFERAPFIVGVNQGHVDFAYKGAHRDLVDDRISPADVAWISNWLGRLSDRQWRDAFRAGGYEPAVAARFIKRLRDKVSQGRALDYSWRKASTGSSAEAARAGQ